MLKEAKIILHSFLEYMQQLVDQPMPKAIIALLLTILAEVFGPWTDTYTALLIVTVLDTITGVWHARDKGTLKASTLRNKTFVKACVYLILLAVGYQVQKTTVSVRFLSEAALQLFVIYLMLGEVISILRHLEGISGRRFKFLNPKDGIDELLRERKQEEQDVKSTHS